MKLSVCHGKVKSTGGSVEIKVVTVSWVVIWFIDIFVTF